MLNGKKAKRQLKRWGKRAGIALVSLVLLFFLLDLLFPLRVDVIYSPVIAARDGSVLHAYLTRDQQWRMKARLDEITPGLRKAIVYKEDKHFYCHFGIDVLAAGRALFNNIFQGRRTSGASTITMQVARMLDRKPRTYGNKLVEMFRALQLEKRYSKDEILQLYLNLVPYGSNIQGVKAASVLYFGKSPDQLSLAEITALSIIPNRPNALVIGRDNPRIVKARNQWLSRFGDAGLFDSVTIRDAMAEPLSAVRLPAPDAVPQLSERLRRAYPGEAEIRATIDVAAQKKAEDLVHNYSAVLKLHGIYNAAVIVLDNRSHEVIAYVGSPDFKDKLHHGEVDGVRALRSPGSALKPLVYGLAFDAGQLTPHSVLEDVPINIAGYAPENYDLEYRGPVSMEDALRQSLNIPAVQTLRRLGMDRFNETLFRAGFLSVWQSRKKLGLSEILGGCGVRLDEMAGLYSAFANEGRFAPSRWIVPDSVWMNRKKTTFDSGTALVSPASAYILTQVLSELARPDLPSLYDRASGVPKIAWKTGTSYGRRDGWSIGYNRQYTIAVWVGNFSGVGVPDLSGANTATPLLFQLFQAIDRRVPEQVPDMPSSLSFRLVCKESGLLPDEYCTEQVMDYYIPGVSGNTVCHHYKEVPVSADGKYAYCTSCQPANGYKMERYPNLSPALAAFNDARGQAYSHIPPHNPECGRMQEGTAPLIRSLTDGGTYLIADRGKQQLQLSCMAANDVQTVYWYVNDRFVGAAAARQSLFFVPEEPSIKISCTDDKGRNKDIRIRVKFL